MRSSSSRSLICPCATTTPRLGHDARQQLGDARRCVCTRLCTKKTCPPRRSSRRIASRTSVVVEAADLGADGEAVRGRRVDHREVAQPAEAPSAACAGSASRSASARRPSCLQLLDALLVAHAEAVLLVDHEQAEVAEAHAPSAAGGGCRSRCRPCRRRGPPAPRCASLGRAEARQRLDAHRVAARSARGRSRRAARPASWSAPARRPACRPSPRGRRRAWRPRSCRSRRRRRPGGPSGRGLREVRQHVLDGGRLVRRLLVRERRLELLQLAVARRERVPCASSRAACTVEQLAAPCSRRDCAAPRCFAFSQRVAAQPVEARRVAVGADVALHQVQPVHGHEEPVAALVLDAQELAVTRRELQLDQAAVDADAVLGVHQAGRPARAGPRRLDRRRPRASATRAPALLARAEDLLLGHDGEPLDRQHEALGERRRAPRRGPAATSATTGRGSLREARLARRTRPSSARRRSARGERAAASSTTRQLLLAPGREALHQGLERALAGCARATQRARAARRGRRRAARSVTRAGAAPPPGPRRSSSTGRRASSAASQGVRLEQQRLGRCAPSAPAPARGVAVASKRLVRSSGAGAARPASGSSTTMQRVVGQEVEDGLEARAAAAAPAPRRPGGTWPRSSASSSSSTRAAATPSRSAQRADRAAALDHQRQRSNSSSRGGAATTRAPSGPWERWLAGSNSRIDSTSSPSSSTRTGRARWGGKTSRMPPRTASSPRSSTSGMRAVARRERGSRPARRGPRSARPRGARERARTTSARGHAQRERRPGRHHDRRRLWRARSAGARRRARRWPASGRARPCAAPTTKGWGEKRS